MVATWVINYFCPILGTTLANAMWVSSIPAVMEARSAQNLGNLNPIPWGKNSKILGLIIYFYSVFTISILQH